MDTTETYIKMCEKAKEIQGERKLEEGDCYAYLRPREGKVWCLKSRQEWLENPSPSVCLIYPDRDYEGLRHPYIDDIEHCWLPRQDQLQEMLSFGCLPGFEALSRILHFAEYLKSDAAPIGEGYSMEQLWLAPNWTSFA